MDLDSPVLGSSHGSASAPMDRSSQGEERRPSEVMPTIWFPLNENVSSSWPPKIAFSSSRTTSGRDTSPRATHIPSAGAMEGVVAPRPQSPYGGASRSATRPIPNRTSRSNSLSVPAPPTSLWREISDLKSLARELAGDGCLDAPLITSRRIRPSPSLIDMEPKASACPSRHDGRNIPRDAPPPPPSLPPSAESILSPSPPSTGAEYSVSTRWSRDNAPCLHLWTVQKLKNPHLPLIPSPFSPLRSLMPPLYWKSLNKPPLQKAQWNFTKPLPSPALPPRFHSRKVCDPLVERLSAKTLFTGKFRLRCRACSQDTLLKRLLLINHWAARAEHIFEHALSLISDPDDPMVEVDEGYPQGVFLKDRDDFDDTDGAMDEEPLITERPMDTYTLILC